MLTTETCLAVLHIKAANVQQRIGKNALIVLLDIGVTPYSILADESVDKV